MEDCSPSVARLCDAAIGHFAERGYEGASLGDIAAAIAIKKASIYAHFPSKDELFLFAFARALDEETRLLGAYVGAGRAEAAPGAAYCWDLRQRYARSAHLRFLIRTAYLPPPALKDRIFKSYDLYLDKVLAMFVAGLKEKLGKAVLDKADFDAFCHAYLGIVDSLHVELIYTNGRMFEKRFGSLMRILADSMALSLGRNQGRSGAVA